MKMKSKRPQFIYSPLQPGEIRLLKPANADDGFAWTLDIASIEALDVEFDALSYTWGSQKDVYPIVCNGRSMSVHQNLYSALPFLARRSRETTTQSLWVDAVCINQADSEEKLTQIRLMNVIYRRAKRVWVWLGCAATEVQAQMPHAIALLPRIEEETKRRKHLPRLPTEEVALPLRHLEPTIWEAILHLLRNPYYRRVWVVQEAALAMNIAFLCGEHEIDFALLEAAVDNGFVHSWNVNDVHGDPVKFPIPTSDNSTLFHIRGRVQKDATSLESVTPSLLLRLAILMSREHDCYDAKDRVFGMLGLVKEEELDATGISLRTCATVQEMYTQVSAYLLLNNDPNMTENWWKYFNSAFTFNKPVGLPSWVPDLHHQKQFAAEYVCEPRIVVEFIERWPLYQRYEASRRLAVIGKGSRDDEIVMRGKILDEIILAHPTPPNTTDSSTNTKDDGGVMMFLTRLADWEQNVARSVLRDTNHDEVKDGDITPQDWRISEETYWRTLLANNLTIGEDKSTMNVQAWRIFQNDMQRAKNMAQRALERYTQI